MTDSPDDYSYDLFPYESKPYAFLQPDRVGAIGWFYGMKPAAADRCRMLEIGCANGGNLIPLGERYPQSEFVGIDLSSRQIADGQKLLARLGAVNVRLKTGDLAELGEELGTFDYIVAHGVYSWVTPDVAEELLAACAKRLNPQGLATISYNTFPGGHFRQVTRDLMLYRARGVRDPAERVRQARAALELFAQTVPARGDGYRAWLEKELGRIRDEHPSFVLHDEMEEHNHPCYFHEFASQAGRHGLKYVADARDGVSSMDGVPPQAAAGIRAMASSELEAEQYADFYLNTMFRVSVLCRQEVALESAVSAARVLDLFAACPVRSQEPVDPAAKAMFQILGENWPAGISVRDLASRVRLHLGWPPGADEQVARLLINQLHFGDIHLCTLPGGFVTTVSERPVASLFSRIEAQSCSTVTNRRHSTIFLDDLQRHLLRCLDGNHDHQALCDAIAGLVASGEAKLPDKAAGLDQAGTREFIRNFVAINLDGLAKRAYLIA
ncbi:MAG TPA: methyltransferase regulatory domain-containing protein [Tepidisphaeraceae bacterium]|nr:methyltransferase regulatory domain-containing protein [Tepidisphaeraceae bacterium]